MTNTVGGQAAETYGYTYSYDGKQTGKNEVLTDQAVTERSTAYAYDELGQLISETGTGMSRQYTYDSRGNRLTMTADGETTGYTYDKNNRMLSASTQDKTQTYHYDPNGNLYSRLTVSFSIPTGEEPSVSLSEAEEGDGAEFFTYNEIGQLTAYEGGGTKATYTYGADGYRKSKTVNGQTTTHIWDGDQMVMETGAQTIFYYRAGGKVLAAIRAGAIGQSSYLYDGHGSVTRLTLKNIEATRPAYSMMGEYSYDAFGNQSITTNTEYNPFQYSGEYYDEETGFTYLRARYYDPTTGRFISEDPVKDGMNWYVYCANDPVNFWDPSGLTITLTGNKEDWEKTFNEIQELTDDTLKYDFQTGIIGIASKGNGKKTTGSELISGLINNTNYDLKIQRNGKNSDGQKYISEVINGNEKGAVINMNDEYNQSVKALVDNGNGTYSRENTASFIILGHEMIHAYHYMNNTYNSNTLGYHYYTDERGNVQKESSLTLSREDDEFETIGIGYISALSRDKRATNFLGIPNWIPSGYNSITENSLRSEHGMKLRAAYK